MISKKRALLLCAAIAATILISGLLVPERLIIPVQGATPADWNAHSFWFQPWGKSGVHRGIDIFAKEGTPVIAASPGLVICTGTQGAGGNAVAILGPKWHVHYYAHLKTIKVNQGKYVSRGEEIGSVGTTGNAAGKPPHLHYSIITQIPYVWRYKAERFGFDRMFYLDPNELLTNSLRNNLNNSPIRNSVPKFIDLFISHGYAAECPIPLQMQQADCAKAIGQAVNHDIASRRNAAGFGLAPVFRIGVRDMQRAVVTTVGLAMINNVRPFRSLAVTISGLFPHRFFPQGNAICLEYLTFAIKGQTMSPLFNQHVIDA